jgi:hypothetical protein
MCSHRYASASVAVCGHQDSYRMCSHIECVLIGMQVLLWLCVDIKTPAVHEQALGAFFNLSRVDAAVKRQLLDSDLLWLVSQVWFASIVGLFSS